MVGVRDLVAALESLDVLLSEEGALGWVQLVDGREGQVVRLMLQRRCAAQQTAVSRAAVRCATADLKTQVA